MAKWWERGLNVAGDVAAYGGVPFTGGLSLLGKKDIREGIGGVFSDITGRSGARAQKRASELQAAGLKEAGDVQKQIYEQSRQDMLPWLESGKGHLKTLNELMAQGAFETPDQNIEGPSFDASRYAIPEFDPSKVTMDPGYAFRQAEGQKGIERSAAARGGLLSGGTLRDITQYGQDLASQEYGNTFGRAKDIYGMGRERALGERGFAYGKDEDEYQRRINAFNRAAALRGERFGRLSGLAGVGQAQSRALGGLGAGFGAQYGQNLADIAGARAGGITGAAGEKAAGTMNLLKLLLEGGKLAVAGAGATR